MVTVAAADDGVHWIATVARRARWQHGSPVVHVAPHLVYFAAIGFGFMLVEISQVQRLTIFLGHPVYSLSVVLFSLLLSSGPAVFQPALRLDRPRPALIASCCLVCCCGFGVLTPIVIRQFEAASTPVRIAMSVAILCPIGFFMGMAFPIGMRRALARRPRLRPGCGV